MQQTFFNKQLVLIGGGHANVQVLKKLCMNEYRGLNVILISEGYVSIYSGMTPGYIRKEYSLNEISIDLQRLCFNAGATFIKDQVTGIDENNKIIYLNNHPTISFDVLSINTGSISNNVNIKYKANDKIIAVKPISFLVSKLELLDDLYKKSSNKKIAIIGGGVTSFELCFSLYKRYNSNVSISLISSQVLTEKNLNFFTKKKLLKIASELNIRIISSKVVSITNSELNLSNGITLLSDIILLSTGSMLPNWLKKSNLQKIENFIEVNEYLQNENYKNIFVSGDIASLKKYKRSKSGVMAVRQGEILEKNIFLYLQNKKLKKFKPQKNWLYLIGTHKNKAVLNYYIFCFDSSFCLNLKKWIDLKFMNKFVFTNQKLMKKKIYQINDLNINNDKMYCQGCGSKVSKNTLIDYLKNRNQILEDSSIINHPSSTILQTIDFIKLFSSFNPSDFGLISYLHSLNDIISGGGSVKSLSASVGLPFSKDKVEKFYLDYFMHGINLESKKNRSIIASGHSYHTIEPGITITMNGMLVNSLSKNLAKEGDLIYLSKPLGIGYLLVSYFENSELIETDEFTKLLGVLKESNQDSANIALNYESKVITDVSGFGLAGHLSDICKASNLTAKIRLEDDILINNKKNLLSKYFSSGFKNNFDSSSKYIKILNKNTNERSNILYDPQTNGPLIIVLKKKFKKSFEKDFLKIKKRHPIYLGKFESIKEYLIKVSD